MAAGVRSRMGRRVDDDGAGSFASQSDVAGEGIWDGTACTIAQLDPGELIRICDHPRGRVCGVVRLLEVVGRCQVDV